MTTPSWTVTMRRAAGHHVIKMTVVALLQALAAHLSHQSLDRPSCAGACARPRADR
ncbi:hypothetical protein [Streptomyces flaveolus]|uniref:hypothetical protein n=1 Tax=Streptomyces flaveolus TaxID=67297 RepID=UPI0036FAD962